jgi:hypothetical protein
MASGFDVEPGPAPWCHDQFIAALPHSLENVPLSPVVTVLLKNSLCSNNIEELHWPRSAARALVMHERSSSSSILVFGWAVSEDRCVRSLQLCLAEFARLIGLPREDAGGVRVPPMSSAWLRAHDADFEKHGPGW